LPLHSQVPVSQQLLSVNLDLSLNEANLGLWQIAAQYGTVEDRNRGAMFLIARVNVWQLVALVIEEVEVDDDSVEHADRRHDDFETTSTQNHGSTRGEVKNGKTTHAGDVGIGIETVVNEAASAIREHGGLVFWGPQLLPEGGRRMAVGVLRDRHFLGEFARGWRG
jgi:hypothetical protein